MTIVGYVLKCLSLFKWLIPHINQFNFEAVHSGLFLTTKIHLFYLKYKLKLRLYSSKDTKLNKKIFTC